MSLVQLKEKYKDSYTKLMGDLSAKNADELNFIESVLELQELQKKSDEDQDDEHVIEQWVPTATMDVFRSLEDELDDDYDDEESVAGTNTADDDESKKYVTEQNLTSTCDEAQVKACSLVFYFIFFFIFF